MLRVGKHFVAEAVVRAGEGLRRDAPASLLAPRNGPRFEHPLRHDAAMVDPLARVRAALAVLTDEQLAAIAAATYAEGSPSPALMAWVEHVVDNEQHRRIGVDLPMMQVDAAIDDTEAAAALATAIAVRDAQADDNDVAEFLAAIVELLGAGN
jgi:hypothetical protein